MKQVEVKYTLSQKGQKELILAGGNGAKSQSAFFDATREWMDFANIDNKGNASVDLTDRKSFAVEQISYNGGHSELIPYTWVYFCDYTDEWVTLDHVPDEAELLRIAREKKQAEEDYLSAKEKYRGMQRDQDNALREANPEFFAKLDEEKRVAKERERQKQEEKKEQEKREQEEVAATARRYTDERNRWCKEHGSTYLSKCLEQGYDVDQLYLRERVALELPGFVPVDGEMCGKLHRSFLKVPLPYLEEWLDRTAELRAAGHNALIVSAKLSLDDDMELCGEMSACGMDMRGTMDKFNHWREVSCYAIKIEDWPVPESDGTLDLYHIL